MTTPTSLREALATALHEDLQGRQLAGCGWLFGSVAPDGEPLCPCPARADAILAHPSMQAVAEHEAVGRAVARLPKGAFIERLSKGWVVWRPRDGGGVKHSTLPEAIVAAWGQPVTEQHQHEWAENWHWHGDLSTRADTPVVQCVRCNAVNESEAIVTALGPSEGERTEAGS